MKKKTFKNKLILIIAVVLCLSISSAVSAIVMSNNGDVTITIDSNNVISEEFLGVGGNNWSSNLSNEGKERTGMTEAYFEIDAKRILTVRPKIMRIMIQPHYIVDFDDNGDGVVNELDTNKGENNWKNGKYNFDSDYMYNFWRYCEVYKAAGTKIELNFGGAVSEEIIDWFGIPNAPDQYNSTRSAPEDLESFAKATAALVKECHTRGFGDTVTLLNFYNESGHTNYSAFGDKREYWCKMLELAHYALKDAGLRDKIIVIGADDMTWTPLGTTNGDKYHMAWMDYIYNNAFKKGYCDTLSSHNYFAIGDTDSLNTPEEEAELYYIPAMQRYSGMKMNLLVTEHNRTNDTASGMEASNGHYYASMGGHILAQINSGVSASAMWHFSGGLIPAPLNVNMGAGKITTANNLWNLPSRYKVDDVEISGIEKVSSTFGEVGLLMRYIETNSKIVKTNVSDPENYRSATAIKGDDTTVVLEVNRSSKTNRNITINLDGRTNKTYYKHIYTFPTDDDLTSEEAMRQFDGNAILPEGKAVSIENGTIKDQVGSGHYLIVYTTLPNAQQIVLEKTEIEIEKTETATINVKRVIGLDSDDVEYTIMQDYDSDSDFGTLKSAEGSLNGNIYIPADDAQSGDTIAIKVSSKASNANSIAEGGRYNTDAYSVAIIRIK